MAGVRVRRVLCQRLYKSCRFSGFCTFDSDAGILLLSLSSGGVSGTASFIGCAHEQANLVIWFGWTRKHAEPAPWFGLKAHKQTLFLEPNSQTGPTSASQRVYFASGSSSVSIANDVAGGRREVSATRDSGFGHGRTLMATVGL